ncbi:MAG: hypothetical protein V4642_14190 [Bacteroidota bacterium]
MRRLLKLLAVLVALLNSIEAIAQLDSIPLGFLYSRRDSAYMRYVDSIVEIKSRELNGAKVIAWVDFRAKGQTYIVWKEKNKLNAEFLNFQGFKFPLKRGKIRFKKLTIPDRDSTFQPIQSYIESNDLMFENFRKHCTSDEMYGVYSDIYPFYYFSSFQKGIKIENVYYSTACVNHNTETRKLINSIGRLERLVTRK